MRRLPWLDRSRIVSACPARWDEMVGEGATRFCAVCKRDVHDVAMLDRAAAEAILRSGEPVCARVTRDARGHVVTRDARPAALALALVVAACGGPRAAPRAPRDAVVDAAGPPELHARAPAPAPSVPTAPVARTDHVEHDAALAEVKAALAPLQHPEADTNRYTWETPKGDESGWSLGLWGPEGPGPAAAK